MSTSLVVKPNTSNSPAIAFPNAASIFDEFQSISNAIAERAFSFFQQRGQTDGQDLNDWFRAETELLKPIPIEISEAETGYTVRAEVPGFDIKDLNVRAEPNAVYIHGKSEQKKEEKQGKEIKYSEFSSTEFCRRIDLPSAIDPEKVSTSLAKGVLELSLSKAAPVKPVEVKAA
jgi:HSP20 family protein